MNKKLLLKRIAALLCVVVIFICSFVFVEPYKADTKEDNINALLTSLGLNTLNNIDSSYSYIIGYNVATSKYFLICGKQYDIPIIAYIYNNGNGCIGFCTSDWLIGQGDNLNSKLACGYCNDLSSNYSISFYDDYGSYRFYYGSSGVSMSTIEILYSDIDIYYCTRACVNGESGVFCKSTVNNSYDTNVGYIQNLQYDTAYERGALYNYNEDSRTDRWKFDRYTTTEVDLTAVNYSVRHYIQPVLVKGYTDEDIVEELDKYFMGEYDASNLEFSYLYNDYERKMEEAGYDGIGFIDAYLLGRFILEWHYFELVDNDAGTVGGYVLMKPTNSKGDFSFTFVGSDGCGFDATTYNPDGTIDENGYVNQEVDRGMGGGLTIEEAFENADDDSERVSPIAGIDGFVSNLVSFTSSIEDVPLGIKSVIDICPSWMLALFGLSFAMTFLAILIKVLRG